MNYSFCSGQCFSWITSYNLSKLSIDRCGSLKFVFSVICFLSNRGGDVSTESLHQGFTHVFESTFESTEGIAKYIAHPAHVEFANLFLSKLDKVLVVDYKPTTVQI